MDTVQVGAHDNTLSSTASFTLPPLVMIEFDQPHYLDNTSGSSPARKYAGIDVAAGEFGSWMPIGAVQTATGMKVPGRFGAHE